MRLGVLKIGYSKGEIKLGEIIRLRCCYTGLFWDRLGYP